MGLNRLGRLALALAGGMFLVGELASAEVWLPRIFGSNMLIQRGQPVRVWGKCPPNASVQISLGSRQATALAGADGAWQVSLDPVPVGGPYTLTASAEGDIVILTNILC